MKGKFIVLLGGDGSGKSTTLQRISFPGWTVVSYSAAHVPVDYLVVRELAGVVRSQAVPLFTTYDPRFRTALYHLFVSYLADVVEKQLQTTNVVCDSYYYKFLAKEKVLKTGDLAVHESWRSYRKPDQIVYLDVPPAEAYQRIISERPLQVNEQYPGATNEQLRFESFQRDLRQACAQECRGIPWITLDGTQPPSVVAEELGNQLRAAERGAMETII